MLKVSAIIGALLVIYPGCATLHKAAPPEKKALAKWEGVWNSTVSGSTAGSVTVILPDPLPVQVEFDVEVAIMYRSGTYHIEKSIVSAMTGSYSEGPGGSELQFRGSIVETGQIIRYVAFPSQNGAEFQGTYESENSGDRGTFHIKKIKPLR